MPLSQSLTSMKFSKQLTLAVLLLSLSCFLSLSVSAQSLDQSRPTPVQSNEVSGTIHARDIGDARLTDHFYAFTGTPGDVLITVEGKNLNGDVDIFTAAMRPLLKFALYAGSVSPVTKSVYLRTREDLILRVQARTPDDDDGSYRLRFGGSFEPITSGSLLANAEPTPEVTATVPKGRRVTSAGARIYEPPEPVAVAPTPEPTPEVAEEKPTPEETKSAVEEEAKPATPRTTPRRGGRRQPGRRTRTPQPVTTEPSTTTDTAKPAEETPEAEPKPAPTRRGTSRRTARTEPSEPPVQEPESGPRLIIETNDGTLINRYMSGVRRVTVERNLVVVIGKDGKIDRIPLDTIVRMTIAP